MSLIKKNKIVFVLVVLISIPVLAQQSNNKSDVAGQATVSATESSDAPQYTPVSSKVDGVAIDGYDPVAYFTDNKAVEGNEQYVCDYNGTTWHFSSQENRDAFLENPEKYTPQFGGYCAHSITEDKIVTSDPNAFIVEDDKLYLYKNKRVRDQETEKDHITLDLEFKKRRTNWSKYQANF